MPPALDPDAPVLLAAAPRDVLDPARWALPDDAEAFADTILEAVDPQAPAGAIAELAARGEAMLVMWGSDEISARPARAKIFDAAFSIERHEGAPLSLLLASSATAIARAVLDLDANDDDAPEVRARLLETLAILVNVVRQAATLKEV